jgi:signal transduction histidine kinase
MTTDRLSARLTEAQEVISELMAELEATQQGVIAMEIEGGEPTELEVELAQTNTGMVALAMELEQSKSDLESANIELEAFSYSVSHDLKSPLRGIRGFSRALLELHGADLPPEALEFAAKIKESAETMNDLIDALLALSRITRSDLSLEAVDLGALAREVEDELRRSDPERSVALTVEDSLEVGGDKGMLRALLANLLGNAWKFTGEEEAAEIRVGKFVQDGEVIFCVEDNGAGFTEEQAGHLFGAFRRAHSADRFGGTGIGLATARRIVHRHGGRIWAEGEPDVGARFCFSLGASE